VRLLREEGKANGALTFPGAPSDAKVHYSFSTTSTGSAKGAPCACVHIRVCVRAYVRACVRDSAAWPG